MPIRSRPVTAAKISLVALLLFILTRLAVVFQTEYQLVSPIVPRDVVYQVSRPFIVSATIGVAVCIVSLILYFYRKHLLVVILCGAAITALQLYA